MQHRRAFDNASLHGDRSRNETGRDSKHTLSLFFMKRFFQLRYLRYKTLLNHLKALWFVLLLSQSRPRPSPTILNHKDSFLFLSFCLPLVAETAATPSTPPPLSSTPPASFLYESCLPLNFPSAQLHVTQLSSARLGSGTSGSPEHHALASKPPAVTSAGPVRCHDAGRVVGKNRTSQA